MSEKIFDPTSHNFIIEIIDFSGPLDLLYSLIKEKKRDIMTVDVIVVTDQYLEYVRKHLSNSKIDDMIEYLSMATYLLELKSKLALPVSDSFEKSNHDMERDAFIQRILLYKQYQNLVPELNERFKKRVKMHSKNSESFVDYLNTDGNDNFLPANLDIKKIISAMQKLYLRFQDKKEDPIRMIEVREISIEEVEEDIIKFLENVDFNNKITLSSLLADIPSEKFSKQYFVVAFVALLVLARNSIIFLEQDSSEELYITKLKDREEENHES